MEECLGEIEKKGFTMIEMGSDETTTVDWQQRGGGGGLKRLMVQRWKCAERAMLLMWDWNERGKEGSAAQREKKSF